MFPTQIYIQKLEKCFKFYVLCIAIKLAPKECELRNSSSKINESAGGYNKPIKT